MARRKVGIRDVAEAAGVSATTVSHALNGKGRVPAATRERVREAAQRLGYRPSAAARALVDGRTGLLGLVLPAASGVGFATGDVAYFMQLSAAATRVAMQRGYALVVAPGADDGSSPFAGVDVDGAVVVDPVARDPLVAQLEAEGLPVVTTGRVPGGDGSTPWVDNDHGRAARSVLDHLRRSGATRVALVTSQPDTSYGHDVEAAYLGWCERSASAPLVVRAAGDLDERAAARAALDEPGVDAVFATLDRLALATLHEAQRRGREVPRDLLVAGATDSEAARWGSPPLTVLDLHPDRIGREAAQMLADLVEGRPLAIEHRMVDARLVPRASTRRRAR